MTDIETELNQLAINLEYPELDPCSNNKPPTLPSLWTCVALLHPFSPPPLDDIYRNNPFFQLCVASITYQEGAYLSAQIAGTSYGTWWYIIYPDRTELSTDKGKSWNVVDMGWTLPSTNWFGEQVENATCAGLSYLNWMMAQKVDWWKIPVESSPATTWFWFNASGDEVNLPFRIMFGQAPQSPFMGDPKQLALFQMYSFIYFPSFTANIGELPTEWQDPQIVGFQPGNAENYEKFIWNDNFGMTTFMVPVDAKSNPLPTRVLYKWKSDADYKALTARAQSTLMQYEYNPNSDLNSQTALMFGIAPTGVTPPANSGKAFLIDACKDGSTKCSSLPLGAQPPDWVSIPEIHGTIQACITNNPTLCPHQRIMVVSVIFPASKEYPQGRYLWTWYSPFPGSNGLHSRPVTFMESASEIGVGTSLALADYFDYQEFRKEIDPRYFQIPRACNVKTFDEVSLSDRRILNRLLAKIVFSFFYNADGSR